MCWYAGPAAHQAAIEDGLAELEHDWYVRNENPRTITTTFASADGRATLPYLETDGPSPAATLTIADVLEGQRRLRDDGEGQLDETIWVHGSGGVADHVYSFFSC